MSGVTARLLWGEGSQTQSVRLYGPLSVSLAGGNAKLLTRYNTRPAHQPKSHTFGVFLCPCRFQVVLSDVAF